MGLGAAAEVLCQLLSGLRAVFDVTAQEWGLTFCAFLEGVLFHSWQWFHPHPPWQQTQFDGCWQSWAVLGALQTNATSWGHCQGANQECPQESQGMMEVLY